MAVETCHYKIWPWIDWSKINGRELPVAQIFDFGCPERPSQNRSAESLGIEVLLRQCGLLKKESAHASKAFRRRLSPEPMVVQHDDRAISQRQRWERAEPSDDVCVAESFEYPNRCDWRCTHDI